MASVIIRPMKLPRHLPGLKWLTVVIGLYAVVWLSLEGALVQVIALATGLALLSAGYFMQRVLGGRTLTPGTWLLVSGALGAATGLSCGLMTLALMAIKTGLHGHGPEFTNAEIEWLVSQMPLWTLVGAIAGLGLGFLALSRSQR